MAKSVSKPKGEVLIVGDEESEVRLFEIAFDEVDENISVTSASDGEQAVELLQHGGPMADAHLPDVVILALDLPKLNGIQVLRRFRDDEVLSGITTVICSHHSSQETIDACYELGAKAYFVKPFDYEELLQIARQITTFWTGDIVDAIVRERSEPAADLNLDTPHDNAQVGLVLKASKWHE